MRAAGCVPDTAATSFDRLRMTVRVMVSMLLEREKSAKGEGALDRISDLGGS
jgi:hypothetical protein